jgi:predicted aspartyl protease
MIYMRIIFLIFFILQSFLISCGSSIKDVAIKKQEAAFYYYEQRDYQNAKRLCDQTLEIWRTIKNSNIKSVPSWYIEDNIYRCEKLLEIIPTSEVLKTPALVPIRIVKNAIYVFATLNQKEYVTLLLDTGSSITMITPDVAELLGISPEKDAPKGTITPIGGKTIEAPFVNLSKIKVGDAVVNNLMVGVYLAFPNDPLVDGILGADFLGHFTVTVDHDKRQLRLVSQREKLFWGRATVTGYNNIKKSLKLALKSS